MKYVYMCIVVLCMWCIVGCDAPSISDDYADLDTSSLVVSKKQVKDNICLYKLKVFKKGEKTIYYTGDYCFKTNIKLYAPTKFAEVGDVVGITSNGTYGVIQ